MEQTSPDDALNPSSATAKPQSLFDLYWSFTLLALQGFGGVLAIVQREIVERKRWLSLDEFIEDWAVAQIMPGPNVVNLSMMIGNRHFGLPGALAALAGMLSLPLVVVLILVGVYAPYAQLTGVSGALRGMAAVTVGLIAATALKMLPTLKKHPFGLALGLSFTASCFLAIAILRWPLAWVLIALGGLACVLCYRRLSE